MKWFFLGVFVSMTFLACSMGSKAPDFDKFPTRSAEFSVWQKCTNDYTHVCKNVCTKYTRKNVCKEGHSKIEKLEVKKALDSNYVIISKAYFLKLLKGL